MTVPLRIRRAGQYGIITDGDARDLPVNAFSAGNNIRFDGRSVRRSPVFRLADSSLSTVNPAFVYAMREPAGVDKILYAADNGRLYIRGVGEVSPAGFSPTTSTAPWTAGILGSVVYINRGSDVPYCKSPTDNLFVTLPGWSASWRCQALRPFLSFVVAMNVQKGVDNYPAMVKWSDRALTGDPPASWDATLTTNLAGENEDIGSKTGIVDGLALGNTFILYTEDEIWTMPYIGGQDIFAFRRISEDGGMINANCAVEVDGKHYVFGPKDIYVFDGMLKHSLVANRVQEFIFGSLVYDARQNIFVYHNKSLSEVWFCYQSSGDGVYWLGSPYPNKAAVYNYVADTWSFMDLPNVSSMTTAEIEMSLATYDTTTLTYDTAGGSYASLQNAVRSHVVAIGAAYTSGGLTGGRMWVAEPITGDLSLLPFPVDAQVFRPAFIERVGLGDIYQEIPGLEAYKRTYALYPSLELYQYGVKFRFGYQETINDDVQWSAQKAFTTSSRRYRIHGRYGGRYLGFKLETVPGEFGDFSFSGLDMDIRIKERR